MASNYAFEPAHGKGVAVTTGVASAATAIGDGYNEMCFTNLGSYPCYVAIGRSTVAATALDYVVMPGTQIVLGKSTEDTHVAYLELTAATTLHVIPGRGI